MVSDTCTARKTQTREIFLRIPTVFPRSKKHYPRPQKMYTSRAFEKRNYVPPVGPRRKLPEPVDGFDTGNISRGTFPGNGEHNSDYKRELLSGRQTHLAYNTEPARTLGDLRAKIQYRFGPITAAAPKKSRIFCICFFFFFFYAHSGDDGVAKIASHTFFGPKKSVPGLENESYIYIYIHLRVI